MPKKRIHNPSTAKDGNWFPHIGHDDGRPLCREKSTNTGRMLSDQFRPESSSYPPQPPPEYVAKDTSTNFKHYNPFSTHDNREQLANDVSSFGTLEQPRTMGRRMPADASRDQQRSEPDMLYHYGRKLTCHDYNTIYSDNYRGCQSALSLRQCGGAAMTPNCRKFPRQYPRPAASDAAAPVNTHGCEPNYGDAAAPHADLRQNENATLEYVDGPYRRQVGRLTTEDLGRTQRQYIKDCGCLSDAWKYSYRGLPRCYPSSAQARIDSTNPYPGWFLRDGITSVPVGRRCIANV